MAAELMAGLGIFKSLYDSAKALKDINDAAIRNAAVIELQEKILAAREAQTTLLDRVGQLEKEMTRLETLEAEKKRYQLEKLPPGVIVRTLKKDMAAGEPIHHICENCYQGGKISPLHQDEQRNGVYHLSCTGCGAKLQVGHFVRPDNAVNAARRGGYDWME